MQQIQCLMRTHFLFTAKDGCEKNRREKYYLQIWYLWTHLFAVSSRGRRGREHSGVTSIKASIPFMRTPYTWNNYLRKTPPPNTLTLRRKILTDELGRGAGYKYSVYCSFFKIAKMFKVLKPPFSSYCEKKL